MKTDIASFLVESNTSILRAMQALEESPEKLLFVVDDQRRLIGSLTDGDIRRWILAGGGVQGEIGHACNPNPQRISKGSKKATARKLMLESGIQGVPVVDGEGRILDILFWKQLFQEEILPKLSKQIDAMVVVMAGGKGIRLAPFTSILPKPLIPIGGKAILEIIMDRFQNHGCSEFIVSVQHKARIIKAYFEELAPPYSVEFLEEDRPMGTAGALVALQGRMETPFFVTNCDILVDADYSEILDHHVEHGNMLTIVGCLKQYTIPYGICHIGEGGVLEGIEEKPQYGYLVNTGMYVLSPSAIDFLPRDREFHMTDLIERIKSTGGKVGVFPIGENRWFDIGEWAEYHKTIQQFQAGISP